jgi:SAM-dependent methyltransferase
MTALVNWRKVIEMEWDADRRDGDMEAFWDARADDFARGHAKRESGGLAGAIVGFVDPAPGETLLDLGCGAGTLTLPFAERMGKVTAVDVSGGMLAGLAELAAERGLRNIRTVKGRFRELPDRRIGRHDIVISCRSFGMISCDRENRVDPEATIRRMTALAKSRAYLFFVTHSIALDPDFLGAFRPDERTRFWRGEQATFALAHSFGLMPRLEYLPHPVDHAYDDPEEAYEVNRRMIGLEPSHRERFLKYFRRKAKQVPGEWHLSLPGVTQCIWWSRMSNWDDGLTAGTTAPARRKGAGR